MNNANLAFERAVEAHRGERYVEANALIIECLESASNIRDGECLAKGLLLFADNLFYHCPEGDNPFEGRRVAAKEALGLFRELGDRRGEARAVLILASWDRSRNQGHFRSFGEGHLRAHFSSPSGSVSKAVLFFVSFIRRAHEDQLPIALGVTILTGCPVEPVKRLCLPAGRRIFNPRKSAHCSNRGVGPSRRSPSARCGQSFQRLHAACVGRLRFERRFAS
jgi:hypothetical protein